MVYKEINNWRLNMHNDIVRWDNKLKKWVKTGRKLI
tara:strand:+ start:309 stop:416 length:108 start_codon:yes stop_codon:yes gene_type:complete